MVIYGTYRTTSNRLTQAKEVGFLRSLGQTGKITL